MMVIISSLASLTGARTGDLCLLVMTSPRGKSLTTLDSSITVMLDDSEASFTYLSKFEDVEDVISHFIFLHK